MNGNEKGKCTKEKRRKKSSFCCSELCLKQDLRELMLSVIGRGEIQLKSDWLRKGAEQRLYEQFVDSEINLVRLA